MRLISYNDMTDEEKKAKERMPENYVFYKEWTGYGIWNITAEKMVTQSHFKRSFLPKLAERFFIK